MVSFSCSFVFLLLCCYCFCSLCQLSEFQTVVSVIAPVSSPFTLDPHFGPHLPLNTPTSLQICSPWSNSAQAVSLTVTASAAGVLATNPTVLRWSANDGSSRTVWVTMPAGQTTIQLSFAVSDLNNPARFTAPPTFTVYPADQSALLAEVILHTSFPIAPLHAGNQSGMPFLRQLTDLSPLAENKQYLDLNDVRDTGLPVTSQVDASVVARGVGWSVLFWLKLDPAAPADHYLFSFWRSGSSEVVWQRAKGYSLHDIGYWLKTMGNCLEWRYPDFNSWSAGRWDGEPQGQRGKRRGEERGEGRGSEGTRSGNIMRMQCPRAGCTAHCSLSRFSAPPVCYLLAGTTLLGRMIILTPTTSSTSSVAVPSSRACGRRGRSHMSLTAARRVFTSPVCWSAVCAVAMASSPCGTRCASERRRESTPAHLSGSMDRARSTVGGGVTRPTCWSEKHRRVDRSSETTGANLRACACAHSTAWMVGSWESVLRGVSDLVCCAVVSLFPVLYSHDATPVCTHSAGRHTQVACRDGWPARVYGLVRCSSGRCRCWPLSRLPLPVLRRW